MTENEKGFFGKLLAGDYGLAKTYWLYGVLVGFVGRIVMIIITTSDLLFIFTLALMAYQICVLIGVWRAAKQYKGEQVWAILAQIAVILGAIFIAFGLLILLGSLS